MFLLWVAALIIVAVVVMTPKLRAAPLFVFFMIVLPLEDALSKRGWCCGLKFPRSPAELRDSPRKFFALVRDNQTLLPGSENRLPDGCRLADACVLDGQSTEPDKNAVSIGLRMRYYISAEAEEDLLPGAAALSAQHIDVFVKFQCGRGLQLWIQALRSAMAPGLAREVEFYNRLANCVPQRVARPYYAGAAHWCNRVCLVLEHLGDAVVVPDWAGGTAAQLRAVAMGVASMHAKWWGCVATDPATNWIPAKAGLDFAGFITGFLKHEPQWLQEIWNGLQKYFAEQAVTLVHGDCRLGNMFFSKKDMGSAAASAPRLSAASRPPGEQEQEQEEEVIFSDWEAVNVGPALWDFAYLITLSQAPAERRERTASLLKAYLAALRRAGVREVEYSDDDASEQLGLLQLVLFFVSYIVAKHKLWSGQGNTKKDGSAWSHRVAQAVDDVLDNAVKREAAALALEVSVEHVSALHNRVVHSLEAMQTTGKGKLASTEAMVDPMPMDAGLKTATSGRWSAQAAASTESKKAN